LPLMLAGRNDIGPLRGIDWARAAIPKFRCKADQGCYRRSGPGAEVGGQTYGLRPSVASGLSNIGRGAGIVSSAHAPTLRLWVKQKRSPRRPVRSPRCFTTHCVMERTTLTPEIRADRNIATPASLPTLSDGQDCSASYFGKQQRPEACFLGTPQ
jgi:hypothetical protein